MQVSFGRETLGADFVSFPSQLAMPDPDMSGADPIPRDFAVASLQNPTTQLPTNTQEGRSEHANGSGSSDQASSHVHYVPSRRVPGLASTASSGMAADPTNSILARSDTEAAMGPDIRRHLTRVGTFKTVDYFEDFAVGPGWHRMFSTESQSRPRRDPSSFTRSCFASFPVLQLRR